MHTYSWTQILKNMFNIIMSREKRTGHILEKSRIMLEILHEESALSEIFKNTK